MRPSHGLFRNATSVYRMLSMTISPALTRRLLLALALAAPLAACGRKGDPEPPEGADEKFPRQYPAPRRT